MWPEIYEEKQSTPHVIRLTKYISDPVQRRLPMDCGREESQMQSILESLEVLVSFLKIEKMWESLTPEAMKEYFWDTPPQAKLIRCTTKEPRR